MKIKVLRPVRHKHKDGSRTKTRDLLSPDIAHDLYLSLHRVPTLVVALSQSFVRRNPGRRPADERWLVDLETFVRYKTVFRLVRDERAVDSAFAAFTDWCSQVACDGDSDPRVLPLHMFELVEPCDDLDTPEGSAAFKARYGPARQREDDGGKRWTRAERGAFHGREQLEIAGKALPHGFHWDLTARRTARIMNAREVWQLQGPRAYLNVYPDSAVRLTRRAAPHARQVWPKQK